MSDVLLRFLSNRLIDLGGDDAKLDKLRETAQDVRAALETTPTKAVPFSLIAFDPEAPEADPVVSEVLKTLDARWPTHVNTFAGTPITVVRALLLDALVAAADKDDRVAIAFAASARNLLPRMPVRDERAIWLSAVRSVEGKVDARAEAEWAAPSKISVPDLSIDGLPKVQVKQQPVKVDREALTKAIDAAAGPNTSRGPTGGNPQWPQGNQNWATEFSNWMTKALADLVEGAVKTNVDQVDFSKPLLAMSNAVSHHLRAALDAVSAATAGLQRRTNLLWWKEALFSASAQSSYRDMSDIEGATLMAFDLYQSIPAYSPASVAAFLRETVISLLGTEGTKKYPLHTLIEAGGSLATLQGLRATAAALAPEPRGRGPVLSLVGHQRPAGWSDAHGFRDLVGTERELPVDLPTWSLWLFRELQALRAVQEPGPPGDVQAEAAAQ